MKKALIALFALSLTACAPAGGGEDTHGFDLQAEAKAAAAETPIVGKTCDVGPIVLAPVDCWCEKGDSEKPVRCDPECNDACCVTAYGEGWEDSTE